MKNDHDEIEHPKHYQSDAGIECIQAIAGAVEHKVGMDAVCTANIIKYLWRCEDKGGDQDIEKARWYLAYMIKLRQQ